MACGLCLSGWTTYFLRKHFEWDWKETYPVIFGIYAVVGLMKACLTLLLTDRCEPDYTSPAEPHMAESEAAAPLMSGNRRPSYTKSAKITGTLHKVKETVSTKISRESRPILIKLCFLFAINSFAQGMLPVTLMSWYVNYRYRWFLVNRVGYAMAAVWLVASIANLFSASVARRIGLVRAMVFTHMPNAIFLAFIPLASKWYIMLVLLLVSSAFGSMDQAPRSAFVAAVFPSSERTAVMGTINLVKTIASAGGPLVTGYFHDKKEWRAVFVTSALLKICYDIGLLAMFLNTKLPEHGRRPREVTVSDIDVGILLSEHLVDPEEFERDDDDEEMSGSDGGYAAHNKARYEQIEEI